MNTHTDKSSENKSLAVANSLPKKQSNSEATFQFVDNRTEAIAQRKLQEDINNSATVNQLRAYQSMADNFTSQTEQLEENIEEKVKPRKYVTIQKKENKTGLPDNLKSGIENLSGYSMDDVKVHYNSSQPTQLNAHAYAQGTDIHLASGQEKHLPHEAWHVVQQKQGRVKPTMQMKGMVNVNDDDGLEKEADVMGAMAIQRKSNNNSANKIVALAIAQRKLNKAVQSKSNVVQCYKVYGAEEENPEGSVKASKNEIFRWLNGENMWSQVATDWCLIGGSAHVEIIEHLLSSNFDGVVTALVSAMGIVPSANTETKQEYIDFFVHEVMTTEDLDIAVSNPLVAAKFPANQAEAKRLLCPEYSKPGVDLLFDPTAERFQLPNGVWVVAPESLTGKPKGGRASLLAAIGANKAKDEQLDGKGRKRTARNEIMKSVLHQGLLDKK